ncbi:MAG: peptide chain release factor N(5)-glutamine methyltransferase [Deltaproteobacteria bacterium]|nr:peptide chain release factor N(5)-glutamine methyltransferase [Deltaproteobacteria bacterium]
MSSATEPRTTLAYLQRAADFLAARGVANARLDAEVLLASVLAIDRVGVYLRFDQPLAPREIDAYRELVRRRAGGEPVAYLTGRREFWSIALAVTPDVLIPRPETELLVERVLALVAVADVSDADGGARPPLRILDLGTGSGALAIALARALPQAIVTAVDVSPAAVTVAAANAREAGVADRVTVVVGSWTSALDPAARFDVIVSNPPYVPTAELATLAAEVRAEPALALDGGADGLVAYRAFVPGAVAQLTPGGRLLVEVGAGQAEAVAAILVAAGLENVAWHADLAGVARVVVATAAAPALAEVAV